MAMTRLWLTALPALLVGCMRGPDRGGQEGEEFDQTSEGAGSGVGGEGEGEGEGEGGGGGGDGGGGGGGDDTGPDISTSYEHLSGERVHLRGSGAAGEYACSLLWSMDGVTAAAGCPDCAYTFDVTFSLDVDASYRDAYACEDVYVDDTATIGLIADYYGYGPAVVGIYEDSSYLLGFAQWEGREVVWSYGYIDEVWFDDGVYYTWFFEASARLE